MSYFSDNFLGRGQKEQRYYVENQTDPFDDFHHRNRNMITSSKKSSSSSSSIDAPIDWTENSESHVFKINLDGIRKNEVKVEVENDRVICVIGEKIVEKEEDSGMWHRVERISGKFIRRISLPEDANAERVKAEMNNGMLIITVPKHHLKKTCNRTVQVSGY